MKMAGSAALDPEGKLAHTVIKHHFKCLFRIVTRGEISTDLYAKEIPDDETFVIVIMVS